MQPSSLASRRMKILLSIKAEVANETMMETGEIQNMKRIMKNDEEYDEEEENGRLDIKHNPIIKDTTDSQSSERKSEGND